jgi:hypothetical protein
MRLDPFAAEPVKKTQKRRSYSQTPAVGALIAKNVQLPGVMRAKPDPALVHSVLDDYSQEKQ